MSVFDSERYVERKELTYKYIEGLGFRFDSAKRHFFTFIYKSDRDEDGYIYIKLSPMSFTYEVTVVIVKHLRTQHVPDPTIIATEIELELLLEHYRNVASKL